MFDHFVDKYKEACVIRQMTKTDWIQIILLSISIVISLVAPFLTNGVILIIGIVAMIAALVWIIGRSNKERKKFGYAQESFNKRIINVETALKECKLNDEKSIDWLLDISGERLNKEPSQEFLKPFASVVAVPAILGFIAGLEEQMSVEVMIDLLIVIIAVMFVFYMLLIFVESDIKDMLHSKYRRLEKMNEDLTYIKLKGIPN